MIKDGTALLIERNMDLTESTITNDDNNNRKYSIKGIFMQSDVKNKNGRVYPEGVIDQEARRYIDTHINTHRATGELNHPTGDGSLSINYERVSHKIVDLQKDGKNWIGEALITDKTPMGSIIAGLMDAGVQMGVSSRATGSLKLGINGDRIVQNDFHLITPADIVSDPSAPDAFVTAIMEGREWLYVNGALTECALEQSQDLVNQTAKHNRIDESKLIEIFDHIIKTKINK